MKEQTQKTDWTTWIARAVEMFALGAGVMLLIRLRRLSKALSPAERIVLFGSVGVGLIYLQKTLPWGRDIQEVSA